MYILLMILNIFLGGKGSMNVIDYYTLLVLNGVKKFEQIPSKYQADVKAQLDNLQLKTDGTVCSDVTGGESN